MLKKWFREYVEVNKRDISIIIFFMIMGVIIGIVAYIFLPNEIRVNAFSTVKEVFDISKTQTYISTNIILNGIKMNVILISILAMLSLTLFGKWIVYIIMTFKGAALGIYTILLFKLFGPLWGIVAFVLLVLLVNILYIPALIYITVNFLEINFNIFKAKLNNINVLSAYRTLITLILGAVIMFSSIIVEQISSSIVLNIYTQI